MKIGFIGLGNVGSKLSGSLLRNGFDVFVYDLNSQLTAEFAKKGAKITTINGLATCKNVAGISHPKTYKSVKSLANRFKEEPP